VLIPCPVCGPRDHGEFTYSGDATLIRPGVTEGDQNDWASYVYDRENPRGGHREYWHHVHGCRCWMIVNRNTETHDISGAELVGAWAGHVAPGER
jgi:methylglutamate dehydrogenase subunit B